MTWTKRCLIEVDEGVMTVDFEGPWNMYEVQRAFAAMRKELPNYKVKLIRELEAQNDGKPIIGREPESAEPTATSGPAATTAATEGDDAGSDGGLREAAGLSGEPGGPSEDASGETSEPKRRRGRR